MLNWLRSKTGVKTSAWIDHQFGGQSLYIGGFVILIGLYVLLLWLHATRISATANEPIHILAGYLHSCGDFGFNWQHPPLPKLVAAAPLIARDLVSPRWECGSKIISNHDSDLFGDLFLIESGVDKVVIATRMAALVMSLLLAALVFSAANEMFGKWSALTALALLVFEPNIIGHGTLVTPDVPVTLGFFAAVYALYRYLTKPTMLRLLVTGVTVGFTLASKHSGVLIGPIFGLLLLGDALITRVRSSGQAYVRCCLLYVAAYVVMFVIGFVFVWATYGFRYHALPEASRNTASVENRSVESVSERAVRIIKNNRILPEAYNFGLADVLVSRRPTFIFDQLYLTGKWFYFPLAFIVKTSLALLVLLTVGLLTFRRYCWHRREMLFLLVPPFAYFAVCLLSNFNNGVRHLLPVYPFLIVAAAAAACSWVRQYPAARYVVIVLLLFHAGSTVRAAPNYLAFSNEFWGGTNNSYQVFWDSNVEMQQNLKLVAKYISREGVGDCWFAAYGSVHLARAYQSCRLMPGLVGFWYAVNYSAKEFEPVLEPLPPLIEGTVFLSVTVLPPRGGPEYLPIARTEPVAQIGGSVVVYRGQFHIPLLAALSHVRRVRQLLRRERFEEAVADGRKAVKLAPDDPRTHFWLGMALAKTNQTEEARRKLAEAVQVGQTRQEQLSSKGTVTYPGDVDDFRALKSKAQEALRSLQ